MAIEGQIAVLKAEGRDAEAAAAQRRLDVLNLTRTYEAGVLLDGVKCIVLSRSYDPKTAEVRIGFRSETDGKHDLALGKTTTLPDFPVLTPVDPTYVTPPLPGDWALTAETITKDDVSLPILAITGACDNDTAEQVIFDFRPIDDPAREWGGAGVEDATVTRKEIGGPITPATEYEVSVRYRRGNNFSDRLVLGPVTSTSFIVGGTDRYVAKRASGSIGTSGSLALVFPSVQAGGFWEFSFSARDPLSTQVAAGATGDWSIYEQASGATGTSGSLLCSGSYSTSGFEPTTFEFEGDNTADVAASGERQVRFILSNASDPGTITATLTAKYNPGS